MSIKIQNLTKNYNTIKALDNLSFNVESGIIFGLLGANGAGKSTLLSILNCLSSFDSGEIEIFGYDVKKNKKEIKSISSLVPQNLAFYEKLTVWENIEFFAKIQNATKQNIQNAIEINNLQDILNQTSSTLSGGQKRRLNIAIGLLNEPKIIYFDEPTVGIDPQSRNEILESIKSFKDMGMSVVYTSHYMNEVEMICDDVAVISKGTLLAKGHLRDLLDEKNKTLEAYFLELTQGDMSV